MNLMVYCPNGIQEKRSSEITTRSDLTSLSIIYTRSPGKLPIERLIKNAHFWQLKKNEILTSSSIKKNKNRRNIDIV